MNTLLDASVLLLNTLEAENAALRRLDLPAAAALVRKPARRLCAANSSAE